MGMACLPAVYMFKLNRLMDLGKTQHELYGIGGSYVAVSRCERETAVPCTQWRRWQFGGESKVHPTTGHEGPEGK